MLTNANGNLVKIKDFVFPQWTDSLAIVRPISKATIVKKVSKVSRNPIFECPNRSFFVEIRFQSEEMVSIPMFYGNSHLHYMEQQVLQHINNNKLDLRLRFRAFSPSGLLLWAGSIAPDLLQARSQMLHSSSDKTTLFTVSDVSRPPHHHQQPTDNWIGSDGTGGDQTVVDQQTSPANSYMWLALNRGQLEYQHQLDRRLLPLRLQLKNVSRLDDGLWHELHLQRKRNEVLLQVDQAPHVRAQLSVEEQQLGSLISNQGLYLGNWNCFSLQKHIFANLPTFFPRLQVAWKMPSGEREVITKGESSAALPMCT